MNRTPKFLLCIGLLFLLTNGNNVNSKIGNYQSPIFTASNGSEYYYSIEFSHTYQDGLDQYVITQYLMINDASNLFSNVNLKLVLLDLNDVVVFSSSSDLHPDRLNQHIASGSGYFSITWFINADNLFSGPVWVEIKADFSSPSPDINDNAFHRVGNLQFYINSEKETPTPVETVFDEYTETYTTSNVSNHLTPSDDVISSSRSKEQKPVVTDENSLEQDAAIDGLNSSKNETQFSWLLWTLPIGIIILSRISRKKHIP